MLKGSLFEDRLSWNCRKFNVLFTCRLHRSVGLPHGCGDSHNNGALRSQWRLPFVFLMCNRDEKNFFNDLRPPRTSRSFVGRQKILTCQLVGGAFRQVWNKIGFCRVISDIARSQNVLSASVRRTSTVCRGSRAPQPIRKCHGRHVSGIGAILISDDLASSLKAVSRDKNSACVRQPLGTEI